MAGMDNFEEKSLAYDLRVFYAIVVGKKMLAIEDAILNKNYQEWYRNLVALFPIVYSRVDKDKKNIKDSYKKFKKKALNSITANKDVYFKKDFNAEGIDEIERALLNFQGFLYRVMHNTNQFGSNTNIQGL